MGACGTGSATGLERIEVTLTGRVTINVPHVVAELPATGLSGHAGTVALTLVVAALALLASSRRLGRRVDRAPTT